MNLFGAEYAFSTPLLLSLALPALGLLVYAYLKKGQGQRVIVASTMILQLLRKKSFMRKKFRPPLRFYIELLLILLLLCGIAGLYTLKQGNKIAIVIDNSFSMSATDPESSRGETLLKRVKREAASYIGGLNSSSQIYLLYSSPHLTPVNSDWISTSSAVAACENIKFVYSADNLDSSLKKIVATGRYDQVVIFTDRKLSISETAKDKNFKTKISVHSYNAARGQGTADNTAISRLSAHGSDSQDNKINLKAAISAFSAENRNINVSLDQLIPLDETLRSDKIRSIQLEIPAGSAREVVFKNVPARGLYKLYLEANRTLSAPGQDTIVFDNSAWFATTERRNKIYFVGDLKSSELGLQRLDTVTFEDLSPENYMENFANPEKESGAEGDNLLFIFHRWTPPTPPLHSSLFVVPPPNNPLFPRAKQSAPAEITRWLESHPLTAYLNMPALNLKKLAPLTKPSWALELISADLGTAAFAGIYRGKNYLVLGFEIFPYQGKKSPVLSILTLNILKWLSGESIADSSLSVYNRASLGDNFKEVLYLDGPDKKVLNTDKLAILFDKEQFLPTSPGLLLINNKMGSPDYRAVNFFNDSESNLLINNTLSLPTTVATITSNRDKQLLTDLIVSLILILMFLDMILVARNTIKLGRPTQTENRSLS